MELKPDRLQFTKFLYLLDYCRYSMNGKRFTDIEWIFYHYGPWSYSIPDLMSAVMDRYPFGWVDRSEEYGGYMPRFDPAERLSRPVEDYIHKIVNAFRMRDTNILIEWCYKQTEPMLNAKRGAPLDFSTIKITHQIPEFFPKPKTWEMPTVPEHLVAKREAHLARLKRSREQYQQFKQNMAEPTYTQAMEKLTQENHTTIPNLDKASITWDSDVVDALGQKYE